MREQVSSAEEVEKRSGQPGVQQYGDVFFGICGRA